MSRDSDVCWGGIQTEVQFGNKLGLKAKLVSKNTLCFVSIKGPDVEINNRGSACFSARPAGGFFFLVFARPASCFR